MSDLGPLQPLMDDPSVMEIMINRYDDVYVERNGRLEFVPNVFDDQNALMRLVTENILLESGFRGESPSAVDVRLTRDARAHVVFPPIAANGPSLVIRKFRFNQLDMDRLIEVGSLTPDMAQFLIACVKAGLNICVAGGIGSGKTTVLNALCNFIPKDERIITLEYDGELQIAHPHQVNLETRAPGASSLHAFTMQQLISSALKMRPDRIILSEARGAEVWEYLQAMYTGIEGSLFSIHATSVLDVLTRLEVMAIQANPALPMLAIRHYLAGALHLILQQNRLQDGTRKIINVAEVTGLRGDRVVTQPIFEFIQSGVEDGRIVGQAQPTGSVPSFMQRFRDMGIDLPDTIFKI